MKKIVVPVIAVLLFAACKPAREKAVEQITQAEKKMLNDSSMTVNIPAAEKVVAAYIDFIDKYPGDSLSGEYILKGAEVRSALQKGPEAIELLKKGEQEFPKHPKAPVFLFMQGFLYETQLHDYPAAQACYERFLKKYPEHNLFDDVQYSLKNLGKSDEELIKEFEAKMKQDSLAKAKPSAKK